MAMIGKPIDRIDAHLKVTGAAKYLGGIPRAQRRTCGYWCKAPLRRDPLPDST